MSMCRKAIAAFLAVVMSLSLAIPATAATVTTTTDKSVSTLASVTEKFVDAVSGKAIADAITYSNTHEAKKPQTIDGYTYVDYTEDVTQVYANKCLNYIIGYPDGSVRPERFITRAEAATEFYRLFDGDFPAAIRQYTDSTFKDVKSSHWAQTEISTMYEIGLIDGDGNHHSRPDAPITRAELANLAVSLNSKKFEVQGVPSFLDVDKNAW